MKLDPANITVEGWVAILGVFVAGATGFAAVKIDIVGLQRDISEVRSTQLSSRLDQTMTNEKIDKLFELFYTNKLANRSLTSP